MPPLPPRLDPRRRHGRAEGSALHVAKLATLTLCTLLSISLVALFGTYWWTYRQFKSNIPRVNISAAKAQAQTHHDIDGKDQNILVAGNDDRQTATDAELKQLGTTRDGGSLNTDTMMIIHIPASGAKATLISMPRDSYVAIPGYGMNKLNAAYGDGYNAASGTYDQKRAAGANLLIETVQNLTGLSIDHYVQVDLLGFYRISNAIGGVTVNMCAAVQEPNSGINLHAGVNLIQGTQALAFVRQRYGFPNGLGDLDRVKRQQYFLTAAFRKVASAGMLNPLKLPDLLNAVQRSLYIDSSLDPLALGRQLENLTADNISGKTIPWDGFDDNTPVGSVVVVHPAEVKAFIAQLIGTSDAKLATAQPVATSAVTVDVLNAGSGINLAAAAAAGVLRQGGFAIGQVTNAPSASTTTIIEYADGMQSQAKTLAAWVPGAVLQKAAVSHVTLLLGSDGLTAKKPAAPATASTAAAASASSAAHITTPTTSATPSKAPTAIDSTCIN